MPKTIVKKKAARKRVKKKFTPAMKRTWFLLDARGQAVGRLATQAAQRLLGKDRPDYKPYLDQGAFVVVVNAGEIKFDSKQAKKKFYYRHSRYPGGLKAESLDNLFNRDPRLVVKRAVTSMLPRNSFRAARLRRLKVYKDAKHPHKEAKTIKL